MLGEFGSGRRELICFYCLLNPLRDGGVSVDVPIANEGGVLEINNGSRRFAFRFRRRSRLPYTAARAEHGIFNERAVAGNALHTADYTARAQFAGTRSETYTPLALAAFGELGERVVETGGSALERTNGFFLNAIHGFADRGRSPVPRGTVLLMTFIVHNPIWR